MKIKQGMGWHVHHKELLEWCYDFDERIAYIKSEKPKHEIPTRLRLLKPVKGKLPAAVVKAWETCNEAWKACDEAWKAYNEAQRAHDKAIADNLPALLELHAKECGCDWTPETGIKF